LWLQGLETNNVLQSKIADMVKPTIYLIVIPLFVLMGFTSTNDVYQKYFDETKENTLTHYKLWEIDLYGPILLVDPSTREVYANFSDDKNILKPHGKIFKGILPKEVNIANTALNWNGKRWAMIMLPLPENKHERLDLLSHELFHRSQPQLGFDLSHSDNVHLNEKNGRLLLRLELEALQMALKSLDISEGNKHLTNALIFRKYRHLLYPTSAQNENLLEINEGIATYTGMVMSGRSDCEINENLTASLEGFNNFPTFVRSFAYVTTPVYGYILSRRNMNWNKLIKNETNLTDFFEQSLMLSLPLDIELAALSIQNQYNGERLSVEENQREEAINKQISIYRNRFIEEPHLLIKLKKMSISFDPRNLVPIEGHGTVYPSLRLTDEWGILTASNGALIGVNWDRVTVCKPTEINKGKISGDGWEIELNNGYQLTQNAEDQNYTIVKKE
jgi:hypothetical protein